MRAHLHLQLLVSFLFCCLQQPGPLVPAEALEAMLGKRCFNQLFLLQLAAKKQEE